MRDLFWLLEGVIGGAWILFVWGIACLAWQHKADRWADGDHIPRYLPAPWYVRWWEEF